MTNASRVTPEELEGRTVIPCPSLDADYPPKLHASVESVTLHDIDGLPRVIVLAWSDGDTSIEQARDFQVLS